MWAQLMSCGHRAGGGPSRAHAPCASPTRKEAVTVTWWLSTTNRTESGLAARIGRQPRGRRHRDRVALGGGEDRRGRHRSAARVDRVRGRRPAVGSDGDLDGDRCRAGHAQRLRWVDGLKHERAHRVGSDGTFVGWRNGSSGSPLGALSAARPSRCLPGRPMPAGDGTVGDGGALRTPRRTRSGHPAIGRPRGWRSGRPRPRSRRTDSPRRAA